MENWTLWEFKKMCNSTSNLNYLTKGYFKVRLWSLKTNWIKIVSYEITDLEHLHQQEYNDVYTILSMKYNL
jgi:hypothetical protein